MATPPLPPVPPPGDGAAADGAALPTTPEARAAYIAAAQKAHDFQALTALFKAELLASPATAAALARFDARSHPTTINAYATQKAMLYLTGPQALKQQEARFLWFRQQAAEHLWEIQQKKLFDLQCRWRAGEVALPGIRHTRDFQQWAEYIDHCPWLPPLTADDVACYAAYLRSGTYQQEYGGRWQEYDRYREGRPSRSADDEDEDEDDAAVAPDPATDESWFYRIEREEDAVDIYALPAWYAFHNQYTGVGALHQLLPDVRGPQENYYVQLWREEFNAEHARKLAAGPAEHRLPWAPYSNSHRARLFYLQLFETPADLPRLQRWHEADGADERRQSGKLREANYWYDRVLYPAAGAWPIAAHPDWRVALQQTGLDFWAHQVADVLFDAWHEQTQTHDLGLPVVPPIGSKDRVPFEEVNWADDTTEWAQSVLRGRELAGEPRDFNF